jgi:hypothetical protein
VIIMIFFLLIDEDGVSWWTGAPAL